MPEKFKMTEEEEAYLEQIERITGVKLTTFQQVNMIEMRRANQDGTKFKLGAYKKRKF